MSTATLTEHAFEVARKAGREPYKVADLNLASIFTMAPPAKLDLAEYPNLKAWLERCQSRPAYQKANLPTK